MLLLFNIDSHKLYPVGLRTIRGDNNASGGIMK